MTDEKKVLIYILRHGSITTAEAFSKLGISRLSGRVYDLRAKGIPVAIERVKVTRRDNRVTYVGRYYLPSGVRKQLEKEGIGDE